MSITPAEKTVPVQDAGRQVVGNVPESIRPRHSNGNLTFRGYQNNYVWTEKCFASMVRFKSEFVLASRVWHVNPTGPGHLEEARDGKGK